MPDMSNCPHCNENVPRDVQFCPNCGFALSEAIWPPKPREDFTAPQPFDGKLYTDNKIADTVLGFVVGALLTAICGLGFIFVPSMQRGRMEYGAFRRGLGYGMIFVPVALLGAFATCVYAIFHGHGL